MKVVLMSDSHGRNRNIDMIMDIEKDADMFLHCGDIECDELTYPFMKTVRGNNDYYGDYPEMIKLVLGTHRVLMLHSHHVFSRDRMKAMSVLAKQEECDMVFYGHTHVAKDTMVEGIRLINPGSLYYSRDGRPISYCIVTIDQDIHVEFKFAPFK